MVERKFLVCDLCESIGAVRVTITTDNARTVVDLCDEHRKPIEDLIDRGQVKAKTGTVDFADVKGELGLR